MKIVVTGGAGFIGSTLTLKLQEIYKDAEIYAIDNFWSGHFKNLKGFNGIFLSYSIAEKEFFNFIEEIKPDVIFHMGAISDTTVQDQLLIGKTNIVSFKELLTLAEKEKFSIIYASSASVYGKKPGPNHLKDGDSPENPYAFSKLMMDNMTKKHIKDGNPFPLVGLRFFNVYGEREKYKGKFASMVYQLSVKMMRGENPRLFKWGEQKRDFVYVEDVVSGIIKAFESKKSGIFNIGSGTATTFNQVVKIINKNLGTNYEIEYFDNPYDFYQDHTEADLTESKIIGYEPQFNIERGISTLINNLKKEERFR